MAEWRVLGRPGYAGKRRDDIIRGRNKVYGPGNWRHVWETHDKYGLDEWLLSNKGAIMLYEDAYYEYFKKNPGKLEWIAETASDVYDDSKTNVKSGLDYSIQESKSAHLQDIAIRRCLIRLGMRFEGEQLVQIRSDGAGAAYSPGNIPFHLPNLISYPELEGWWKPGSVESFFQSNKYLQVLEKKADKLDLYGPDLVFVTGNRGKFESARRILGEILKQIDLGTSEPYSDVKENAKHKALTAFSVLCHQVICDDSGLVIPSLGGWPGANVKRVLQDIKLEGFLRKLKGTTREAYFYQVLSHVDWDGKLHFFEDRGEPGVFAEKPRGTLKPWHKSELMRIFIPASQRNKRTPKTVAEMDGKGYSGIRSERWRKFEEFFEQQNLERMIKRDRLVDDDEFDRSD